MKGLRPAVFFIFCLFFATSSLPQSSKSSNASKVAEIWISTPKTEYLLGEPIRLDRRFTKKGDFRAAFEDGNGPGALRVFIAREDDEFRRYRIIGSGAPRKHFWEGVHRYSFETIFFNSKPETAHLSDFGRRKAETGMILTDYAFPEPGEYRIKATLTFTSITEGRSTSNTIESNEITITLKQPEGDDQKVWDIIRADLRLGYLMTECSVINYLNRTDSLLLEAGKIVSDYPDSHLARILKEKVAETRAREERIRIENLRGFDSSKKN